MRKTVDLDDDVNREVRTFAREHGMTLSASVNHLARLGFAEMARAEADGEREPRSTADREQES